MGISGVRLILLAAALGVAESVITANETRKLRSVSMWMRLTHLTRFPQFQLGWIQSLSPTPSPFHPIKIPLTGLVKSFIRSKCTCSSQSGRPTLWRMTELNDDVDMTMLCITFPFKVTSCVSLLVWQQFITNTTIAMTLELLKWLLILRSCYCCLNREALPDIGVVSLESSFCSKM